LRGVFPFSGKYVTNGNSSMDEGTDNYNSSDLPKMVKLQSRFSDNYSSFKITVDAVLFNVLLDSSFWPSGVALRRFFNPRKLSGSPSRNFQKRPNIPLNI
jgi:hypothetical protein